MTPVIHHDGIRFLARTLLDFTFFIVVIIILLNIIFGIIIDTFSDLRGRVWLASIVRCLQPGRAKLQPL